MKHSNLCSLAGLRGSPLRALVALSIFAVAPACERMPDAPGGPEAAIQAEAPLGAGNAKAAQPAQPAQPAQHEPAAECGRPRENCGCDEEPKGAEATAAEITASEVEYVKVGSSPARGPEDAPVTVVVFADFECSFSSKADRALAQLEADYPGKLRFVFKNYPLPIHKSAKLAAKAALAAGEQGKFWEYHGALFADTGPLDAASLGRRAEDLGLDMAKFERAMEGTALDAALDADVAEATRLNIRGTPTLFINGWRVIGAQPLSVLRGVIDKILSC